jgi:hypothetical protein
LPDLVAAQVRILRASPGAAIDPREAYIDGIVLVVPGDPQGLEVSVDNLEVDGVKLTEALPTQATVPTATHTQPTIAATKGQHVQSAVRLHGDSLFVAGRMLVPRMIEWQGEPLPFLAERGFNVVQLAAPPTADQIEQASQHGLWFVCSAPRPDAISNAGLGEPGDRVIGWLLDDEAVEVDPNYARHWADQIRDRDAVAGRPVLLMPEAEWSSAGKSADVIMARHPAMVRLTEEEFEDWLGNRPRLIRPGTPFWTCFDTQYGSALKEQIAALTVQKGEPLAVDAQRLMALVKIACARGVRGFAFRSDSPLTASDAITRRRAAMLEIINRRIQLIEPWLAAGKPVGRVTSADEKRTGVVLHVERARLLVPFAEAKFPIRNSAAAKTISAANETGFIVPGIPESSQAFLLTPATIQNVGLERVAGGSRVVLKSPGLVLLTEDPKVIQSFRQKLALHGASYIRAERDLAALMAAQIVDTTRKQPLANKTSDAHQRASRVTANLVQVDPLLTAGQTDSALKVVESAHSELDQLIADQRRLVSPQSAFESTPFGLCDDMLAENAEFHNKLDGLRRGDNLLYDGDFEDLQRMTQSGWHHLNHPVTGLSAAAELSTATPQQGAYCLELNAHRDDKDTDPALATAPVWIVSPPVPVRAGMLIEIGGWVRIDQVIDNDGLQIVDSLGGPELALAVRQTGGWQPFRMIRAVPRDSELRLTFALCGLGTARIDAVTVRPLEDPAPNRLPPLPTAVSQPRRPPAASTNAAVKIKRLPPVPSTADSDAAEGPSLLAPQTR